MNDNRDKKIRIIIAVFFFGLGLFFGGLDKPSTNDNVGLYSQIESYKELKVIDDQLIGYCSQGFGTISKIFEAQGRFDFETAYSYLSDLQSLTTDVEIASEKRQNKIIELGY